MEKSTKILLSIKPEFANKIFSGEKKYEYRKSIFQKHGIKTVIVYSTMPVGKIIGEFEIGEVIQDHPIEIWKETKEHSGINNDFFDEYFKGRTKAFAIKVSNPTLYKNPIMPNDFMDNFYAPQSFMYIN